MSQQTLDVLRALGPFAGAVVGIVGFGFVIQQLRLNRLSIETQTRSHVYQLSQGVYKLFVDNPNLRPYFYEGKPLPDTEPERSRILAAAELLTDFFEHVVHGAKVLDPEIRETWFTYMRDTYRENPVYSDFLQARRSHYTETFRKVIGSG